MLVITICPRNFTALCENFLLTASFGHHWQFSQLFLLLSSDKLVVVSKLYYNALYGCLKRESNELWRAEMMHNMSSSFIPNWLFDAWKWHKIIRWFMKQCTVTAIASSLLENLIWLMSDMKTMLTWKNHDLFV